MKRIVFSRSVFSFLFFFVAYVLGFSQTAYKVDVGTSTIAWLGEKVIGGSHYGDLSVKSGTVTLKRGKIVSAKIIVDMHTISCQDIESEKWNDKFLTHIKSDDFFSVSTYPKAIFELSKIDKKNYATIVSGTLTIKNISHPISFPADVTYGKNKVSIVVKQLKIDRTKYGIKTMSSSFFDNLKDRAIKDEFTIDITLNASK